MSDRTYTKPEPERLKLAKRLCKLMGWEDSRVIWSCILNLKMMREIVEKLEEKS